MPDALTIDSEAIARMEMAPIARLMARFGLADLTSTHFSTLISGRPGHYLLNPCGLLLARCAQAKWWRSAPTIGRCRAPWRR